MEYPEIKSFFTFLLLARLAGNIPLNAHSIMHLKRYSLDRKTPIQVLKTFVGEINKRKYRDAYHLFSFPLRQKVVYGDFHDAAKHVKWIRILSVKLTSIDSKVAKARVMLEDLEKDPDQMRWEKEKYKGEVVFLREKAGWRFVQVMGNKGGF